MSPVRRFRTDHGPAPLKRGELGLIDEGMRHAFPDRSRSGPIEAFLAPAWCISPLLGFRTDHGPAPLKPACEDCPCRVRGRFPDRSRSGPIEARTATVLSAASWALFPDRSRSGPIEAPRSRAPAQPRLRQFPDRSRSGPIEAASAGLPLPRSNTCFRTDHGPAPLKLIEMLPVVADVVAMVSGPITVRPH